MVDQEGQPSLALAWPGGGGVKNYVSVYFLVPNGRGPKAFFWNGCGPLGFGSLGNLHGVPGKIGMAKNGPYTGASLWRLYSYIANWIITNWVNSINRKSPFIS